MHDVRDEPRRVTTISGSARRRSESVTPRLLVALGGNAIQRAHDHGAWNEAVLQMRRTADALAEVTVPGRELVVTHGNGPQVGNLLREAELGAAEVPVPPLHVLGAETQGQLGYLIAQELSASMQRARVPRSVLPIVSRIEVSGRDPAFHHPSKPVGRFYSAAEARRRAQTLGWRMKEDPLRRGWRRLVPSPEPLRWLEGDAVRAMLDAGFGSRCIFVVAGGGGIPVVRRGARWVGVDAVIDKDRSAALVARCLGAQMLVVVTDVPGAAVGYGGPHPRWLGEISLGELVDYWKRGEFADGSMGPKVEAGIRFLKEGGRSFVITDFRSFRRALQGRAGTRIRAD